MGRGRNDEYPRTEGPRAAGVRTQARRDANDMSRRWAGSDRGGSGDGLWLTARATIFVASSPTRRPPSKSASLPRSSLLRPRRLLLAVRAGLIAHSKSLSLSGTGQSLG